MSNKKQNNTVWGLELGGSALRLVRLTRNGQEYHVEESFEVALEDRWEKPADYSAALAALPRLNITDPLVVCGADERVLFRSLSLPDSRPADLAKMVQSQLEVLIPTQAENFDTAYTNCPHPSEPGRQRVLLYAARREVLSATLKSTQALGVDHAGLIPSILALSCSWTYLTRDGRKPDGPLLLIDVGARCTSIALMTENRVAHCSIIDQAGDHWTEQIAEHLDITPSQAERRKLAYATSDSPAQADPQLHDCLGPLLDNWSRHLREAYQTSLENAASASCPDHCIILGRSASLPGLSELIADTLSLQVDQPKPPERLVLAEGIIFQESAAAIGAALCSMQDDWPQLNMATTKESSHTGRALFSWRWAALLGWLLAAVLSLYGLDRLEASRLSETLKDARDQTGQQGGLARQLAIGKFLEKSGPAPLDVLDTISTLLPEKAILTGLKYNRNNRITVGGTVPNQQEFQMLLQKLSKLGPTDLKTARPDKKEFRFEISLTLETPRPAAEPTPKTESPESPAADTDTKESPAKSPDAKPPEPPTPAKPDKPDPPESPKGGPA